MNNKLNLFEVYKADTIKEIVTKASVEAKDNIAFEYMENKENKKVTYKEFKNDIDILGTALSKINMCDKHIATIGENSYKWILTYITVLMSDGVFVPIDKELTEKEIINVLKSSDTELLFCSKRYSKYIESFKKELPNIKYYICFGEIEEDDKVIAFNNFMNLGKDELKKGNNSFINIEHKDVNKLKYLVYTSGTTGEPKGVMLSEHNMISCVYYGLKVSTVYTKCLSVLPYHHTYEAVAGIITGIYKHTTICINDSLKNVLKNLNVYKPDYIYLVPAFAEVFYKRIIENAKKSGSLNKLKIMRKVSNVLRIFGIDKRKVFFKSIHNAFGGNLKKIVVGGAPLRKELGKFFDDIGIDLINGYGITECSPLVSVNREESNNSSTVGFVLPCLDIKFENVTEDGDGEILVKGDSVMLGYYKDSEKTNRVLKDGWFNTEDYGRLNKKGQLIINGRKKNIIVLSNGKNIYPEEIEEYIQTVPYISEVVVRGIKNNSGEEVSLLAEVFLNKEKVKELNIKDEMEELKKDIAKVTRDLPVYKHIQKIEIRSEEFNKTTTNKIKR